MARFPKLPIIPEFAEDEFGKFVEGIGGVEFATSPKRLVLLLEAPREFVLIHDFEWKELLAVLGSAAADRELESRQIRDAALWHVGNGDACLLVFSVGLRNTHFLGRKSPKHIYPLLRLHN